MKKTTGKVVSLVLALALVVTSFSANFAFASTKSVTGTVSNTSKDEIYLVNGSDQQDVDNLLGWIVPELDTKDHQDVQDVEIAAISHTSGDALVKWDIDDNGDAKLTVKNASKTGKDVLSILYEGTYTNDDGDDVTVKARKNFTVNVLDEDSLVIGKIYNDGTENFQDTGADSRTGKEMEAPATFAQTYGTTREIAVYQVGKAADGDKDAKAVYTPVNVTSLKEAGDGNTFTAAAYIELSSTDNVYFDTATTNAMTVADSEKKINGTKKLTVEVGKGTSRDKDASVSNLTITAKKIKDNKPSSDSDDKYTLKTKVEKKVDVDQAVKNYNVKNASATISGTAYTIDSDKGTRLYLAGKDIAVVTDAEVVFPSTTTKITADDGSVKKISGSIVVASDNELKINDDASVGEVDLDAGDVSVDGGKVGDISTVGTVTVSSGKAGNIDNTDDTTKGDVTINGGTVGTIASDGAVSIVSTDDDTTISTGKVTAHDVTVNSDEAKTSVSGIKATQDDSSITVMGSDATVGTVDFDYYKDVALNLGNDDEDAFVGTVVAPVNAINGKIVTENEDTVATVTGAVNVDTISVASDTSIKFTDAVTVDSVDGDGSMTIAAGKLYVSGSVAGTTLKLSDATLTKGTTVFKSDADSVDADDFNCFGFTLAKSTGTSVDTFKIDTLNFAGLTIDKSTTSIAKGYSETFTAVAYPGGTNLPAGSTVKWSLDGSDDVFEVTSTGNTATVKVISIDSDFASENSATLTATLYDADGYEMDDYAAGSVKLTAIAVPSATSDTTSNFSVAQGASYTFKITSATAPSFGVGTAGVFTVALASHTGNDYFYKITATGKVGAETGVYLNGTKLLVASIKGVAFTSDTTVATTVKGAYTVKITSATTPSFGVGTAGVFKVQFVTKSGNNYFYKLTSAGAVGAKAGVYVNGAKVFVATVG